MTAPPMDWHVTNVAVGKGAEGMDLSPDGRELWVANAQDATVSIVDIATHRVVQTIPSTRAANRLKFTRDGRYVFVSDLGGNDMLVIDAKTRTPHTRIALGANSEGIVMSADGTRAFTTLNARDAVAAIDLRTMTVIGEVKTGRCRGRSSSCIDAGAHDARQRNGGRLSVSSFTTRPPGRIIIVGSSTSLSSESPRTAGVAATRADTRPDTTDAGRS